MPKLLSNRKPVFPPAKLTDDRFKYLGLSQAQPALGEAPTVNQGYTIQTDASGKATFSNTLGELKFLDQVVSTTIPGDMVFTATNGNIVISPLVKAQVTGNFEVLGNIDVKGDNPLGTAPVVSNVLYVTMDGDDSNDGRAMDASRACRTISGAVRSPYYQEGTVIKVSSGHYYEDNPIPLKGYTCVIGDDLRTVFIEPLNRDQDLFHVNSGVYIAQMQMRNLRRGSVERYAPGGAGTYTTGAYCVAFPPSLTNPIDLYYSPYIQNCTNQTGPWLMDGSMFVPNQTVQVPLAAGTSSWVAQVSTITVTLNTGSVVVGMAVDSASNEGYFNAQALLNENANFLQTEVNAFLTTTYPSLGFDISSDVGTIITAIGADARFGGNERSLITGLSYWDGATSVLTSEELAPCVAAIEYLGTLMASVVSNSLYSPTFQNGVSQIINNALPDGAIVTTRIASLITTITGIIQDGPKSAPAPMNDLLALIYPTGISPNQVNNASTVTNIVDNGNGTFNITLSSPTVAASDNATLYFGYTAVYPSLDADIPSYWSTSTNADRRLDPHGAGGGALVDGNAPSLKSPIQSFVFDAFTQVSQGGHGIHIINNGYAQLVSVFTLFCDQAVTTENGGIASITNSNANFGDLCLVSKGIGKLDFSGIVWNPAYPTNRPNGEFYPLGYWPQNQRMEVFIPDATNRPHIGLIMEVVPPDTYLDYSGNRVPYVNKEGFPGYLVAASNTGSVTTGSYTITGIDTTDIAIGHTLYIVDIYGNQSPNGEGAPYFTTGTQVTDVNYQSITLDQPILNGGGDPTGLNPNYLNLYFCGNAYYTVLSSQVDTTLSHGNTATSVIPGEVTTTSQAIAYARDLAVQIINNQTATVYQTTVSQIIDPTFEASQASTGTVIERFDDIIGVITNGNPQLEYNINGQFLTTDPGVLAAAKLLEKNRNFIQAQTAAYAETLWPQPYSYNAEICARDTGLIVDAIAQDMLFGGTSQTTFAAIQYWSQGNTNIPNESYQTTQAIKYLQTLAEQVVTNTTAARYQNTVTQVVVGTTATVAQVAEIASDFNVVLNIIQNGIEGVTDNIVPNSLTSSTNTATIAAFNALQANRSFMQHEIIAYVNSTTSFTYNVPNCYRDTGLLVDAVAFDLLYPTPTNSQSTFAGLQYWSQATNTNAIIPGEITTTTNAVRYLNTLAQEIVQNITTGTRYQTAVPQVSNLPAATSVEASAINTDFTTIINILSTGTTNVTNSIIPNGAASTSSHVVNAYNLLEANRAYLQAEVIAYIDATRSGSFVYNEKKCKRDTGLIVDAIVQDMYFGGTSQTTFAGLQYWNQNGYTGAIGSEITTTTNAINHLSQLAQKIILNDTSGTRYSGGTQVTNPIAAGTTNEVAIVAEEFTTIVNILTSGTAGVTDQIVPNGVVASTTASVVNAYNLLVANRSYLQGEIVSYVEALYPTFGFDSSTCHRDVGYMIDSISFDLLYGGNRQAIQSGVYYYSFNASSSAIPGEQSETEAAYNYMSSLISNIVLGTTATLYQSTVPQVMNLTPATSSEVTTLQAKLANVVNIITNGPSVAPAKTSITKTPSGNANVLNAVNLVEANRAFIQAQVTGWINQTYGIYSYNEDTCSRDIGYMIDSVAFDLLHGGNRQAVQSGVAYYGYTGSNVISTEYPQVTAAYNHLAKVISTIVTGGTVNKSTSNTGTQVTGLPAATSVEAQAMVNNINYMLTIINSGTSYANSLRPISLTESSSTNALYAFNIVEANRTFIQQEIVAYVNDNFANFTYSPSYCYRDTGYIIDSVSFDILYGGNRQATQSGVYYYSHTGTSTVIPGEQVQTTAAYNFIKTLVADIVGGTEIVNPQQDRVLQVLSVSTGTTTEVTLADSLIDNITNIITNGPSVAPEATPITLTPSTSTHVINATSLLEANKAFITAEVIAYIGSNFHTKFSYNEELCARDTGLIVDALAQDLIFGGQSQSTFAGIQYFSQGSSLIPGEQTTTTNAVNYLSQLAQNVIQNITTGTRYQNTVTQINTFTAATSNEVNAISADFGWITTILENGIANITDQIVPNSIVPSTNPNVLNAYANLQANRNYIQNEVVAYVNATSNFQYNTATCYRDVGLIVDSLAFDLMYPTEYDSQTTFAAIQYWTNGSYTGAIGSEITTTTNSIIYLSQLAQKIAVGDKTGTRYQSAVVQTTSTNVGSPSDAGAIGTDFGIILDILSTGPASVTEAIIPNGRSSNTTSTNNAYNLLLENTDYMQAEVLAYINATAPTFVYNTSTCMRDVGYIIDSVAFDLLHGGNRQAIQAGTYYYTYDATTVVPNELPQVTAAYEYMQQIIASIVTGKTVTPSPGNNVAQVTYMLPATTNEVNTLNTLVNNVVNIINNGLSAVPAKTPIALSGSTNQNVDNAFNLLLANREFIQAEVTSWINNTFCGFNYDEAKCFRDVGYMLDSVSFDLLYGGNRQAIQSGVYYYGHTDTFATSGLDNEVPQVTAAYDFISKLSANIVTNTPVIPYQNNVTQVISTTTTATIAEVNIIQANLSTITNIINNGPSVAPAPTSIPLTASTTTSVLAAATLLEDNRAFIVAETIAYINTVYDTEFSFNETTCNRDTGLIVDAIAFDLLFQGESQSTFAALQYWNQDGYTGNIAGEATTTTNAIRYLGQIAQQVILGQPVTVSTGNTSTQVIGTGSVAAATFVADDITTIVNILLNGPAGVTDNIIPNGTTALTDSGITTAYEVLQANRTFLQSEVVARINLDNPDFTFNQATCFRDVGYIIDSVSFDLLYGGNRQAIQSGVYYYSYDGESSAVPSEIPEVAAAYNYIRKIVPYIITGTPVPQSYQTLVYQNSNDIVGQITDMPVGTGSEVTAVQASVDLITSIIENGPTAAPAKTPISLTASTSPNVINAFNILEANRAFIQAEILAYINYTYTYYPPFNNNKCYRDMGSVVDAVIYDLTHGGNYRSVNVGNGYYYRNGQYHIITLEQNVLDPTLFIDGATVNFYQQSYISASGYLFEYVGAGTQYGALPQVGTADPDQSKEVVQLNNGKVFYTSTDQNGDFRIGPQLVISQATGVLSGRTFQKSLYAEMTPFVLVIGA